MTTELLQAIDAPFDQIAPLVCFVIYSIGVVKSIPGGLNASLYEVARILWLSYPMSPRSLPRFMS
jgi:hypothetical protein